MRDWLKKKLGILELEQDFIKNKRVIENTLEFLVNNKGKLAKTAHGFIWQADDWETNRGTWWRGFS